MASGFQRLGLNPKEGQEEIRMGLQTIDHSGENDEPFTCVFGKATGQSSSSVQKQLLRGKKFTKRKIRNTLAPFETLELIAFANFTDRITELHPKTTKQH